MSLTPLHALPTLESEPCCDWAVLTQQQAGQHRVLLAYAAARDFLSVPKTFIMVEFRADAPLEIHQMQRDDYLADIDQTDDAPNNGLFQLACDAPPQICVLLVGTTALEITYETCIEHPHLYHCADAGHALTHFMTQH